MVATCIFKLYSLMPSKTFSLLVQLNQRVMCLMAEIPNFILAAIECKKKTKNLATVDGGGCPAQQCAFKSTADVSQVRAVSALEPNVSFFFLCFKTSDLMCLLTCYFDVNKLNPSAFSMQFTVLPILTRHFKIVLCYVYRV